MENGVEIMSKKLQSDLLLLLTAMIWGSAFVAQKAGATLEPFTYNGIRNVVGAIALIPVILIFSRGGDSSDPAMPLTRRVRSFRMRCSSCRTGSLSLTRCSNCSVVMGFGLRETGSGIPYI